jgi:hypothetical protein
MGVTLRLPTTLKNRSVRLSRHPPYLQQQKHEGVEQSTYGVGPNVAPGSASSVRLVNQNTLEMTDKINGKIADTRQIELSSDLKTLTITVHTAGRSEPNVLVFERQ